MTASQIQPDALLAARERWVARGVSAPAIVAVSADGAHVQGADGVNYLDFAGGIGCQNLGHNPEAVVEADPRAGRRSTCTSASWSPPTSPTSTSAASSASSRPAAAPTRSRSSSTPAPRPSRTRSRSPAPRPAARRSSAFDRGFHGRTLMTMTLTSKVKPYKKGFGPFAPEVYRAPAPYPVPRDLDRRQHRRAGAALRRARRPGDRRRGDPRARAGRGRLHRDARRLPGQAARAVRPPRDPVDRRRGPVRRRPHRPGVGDRALRRAAGPARVRQVARRRAAAGGGHRARGDHGRGRPGRARRHLRRQPGLLRGGQRRARRRCRACAAASEALGARLRAALEDIATRVDDDRRGARARPDARAGDRPRPRDQDARRPSVVGAARSPRPARRACCCSPAACTAT